jgi:CDP-diacylglycerol pyrophosphatase
VALQLTAELAEQQVLQDKVTLAHHQALPMDHLVVAAVQVPLDQMLLMKTVEQAVTAQRIHIQDHQ